MKNPHFEGLSESEMIAMPPQSINVRRKAFPSAAVRKERIRLQKARWRRDNKDWVNVKRKAQKQERKMKCSTR